MPKTLLAFAALILTLTALAGPSIAAEEAFAPEAISDFTLPDLEGGNVSLSDYLGKDVILLNFWATWCTPCLKEMPELNKLQDELASQGFRVISINVDDAKDLAKVKAIVKRFKYTPKVLLDSETKVVSELNKRKDMPFTLIIGKDKLIHHKKKGFTAGDEEKLKEWVSTLLSS